MTAPTKQDMEQAKEWAESWVMYPAIHSKSATVPRCYLHALSRIEALAKVREALVYCVESRRTELSDSAYDKAIEALTNLAAIDNAGENESP